MPPKLNQYLKRTILVSIPALFEDGKCRAHTLQSIETDGLWLSSDELTVRLLPESEHKTAQAKPLVFVPAVQIAAIILPPPTQPGDAAATPARTGADAHAEPPLTTAATRTN